MFKNQPQLGEEFILEKVVTDTDTASYYGSGGIDVFATPAMVSLMENAALQIDKYLEEGYATVGTEICVKHVKATPVGMKVRAKAKLVQIEGQKLLFEVEAFDEEGKIGFGTHRRYVIDKQRFFEKIKR